MNFFKKIGYFFLALLILFCGLIVFCAVNPDMSKRAADFLYYGGLGKNLSKDDISLITVDITQNPIVAAEADSLGNKTDAIGDSPDTNKIQGDLPEEYRPGQEAGIEVPDNVSGRTGYQPVESEEEQLDEKQSREIQEELGTGETGDGLTFSEEFYPYYQMLDESGKHLYRQLYANVIAGNRKYRPVETVPVNKIKDVFLAVYNDHPELFWLDTSYACKYDKGGKGIQIELHFNRTVNNSEAASAEINRRADEIIAQVQGFGNNYEKEKGIHDILLQQIEYNIGAEMNQSMYSALINGQTVCAGYARAFQYLMQRMGIPCYYCTGYAGENHAWNIILLDDGFYNVDVTWDDTPGGEYDYFNKTDQDYAGTHLRKELSVHLPACNGQQYRNLEKSSRESALRSLADTGLTPNDICYDMEEYRTNCSNHIVYAGKGNYAFSNVLEGDTLFQEWYNVYKTNSFQKGYLEDALMTIGADSCRMQLEAESLQDGKYLITHYLQIE